MTTRKFFPKVIVSPYWRGGEKDLVTVDGGHLRCDDALTAADLARELAELAPGSAERLRVALARVEQLTDEVALLQTRLTHARLEADEHRERAEVERLSSELRDADNAYSGLLRKCDAAQAEATTRQAEAVEAQRQLGIERSLRAEAQARVRELEAQASELSELREVYARLNGMSGMYLEQSGIDADRARARELLHLPAANPAAPASSPRGPMPAELRERLGEALCNAVESHADDDIGIRWTNTEAQESWRAGADAAWQVIGAECERLRKIDDELGKFGSGQKMLYESALEMNVKLLGQAGDLRAKLEAAGTAARELSELREFFVGGSPCLCAGCRSASDRHRRAWEILKPSKKGGQG